MLGFSQKAGTAEIAVTRHTLHVEVLTKGSKPPIKAPMGTFVERDVTVQRPPIDVEVAKRTQSRLAEMSGNDALVTLFGCARRSLLQEMRAPVT